MLSKSKIEYVKCKFSDTLQEPDGKVRVDTHVIPKRESFKYLGFTIQGNGEIGKDASHCIRAAWMK